MDSEKMIRYARDADKHELRQMWIEIFGDSKVYIDSFLNTVFLEKNTLLWEENHCVAAMLYMVPYRLIWGGKKVTCMYLYALATKPQYRKRGIMGNLITRANEICKKRGYAMTFLEPAGQELFAYYRNYGYQTEFYKSEVVYEPQLVASSLEKEENCWRIEEITPDESLALYVKSSLFQEGSFEPEEPANTVVMKEILRENGKLIQITRDKHIYGHAVLLFESEQLTILQINVDKKYYQSILQKIITTYQVKQVCVLEMPHELLQEESNQLIDHEYIMVKWLDNSEKYKKNQKEKKYMHGLILM